jgi:hypothetical protein
MSNRRENSDFFLQCGRVNFLQFVATATFERLHGLEKSSVLLSYGSDSNATDRLKATDATLEMAHDDDDDDAGDG